MNRGFYMKLILHYNFGYVILIMFYQKCSQKKFISTLQLGQNIALIFIVNKNLPKYFIPERTIKTAIL